MLEQQPTRLTIDGIFQLINKTAFQGQTFILQTLVHTDNYLGHHYTQISDGFCQVQCQLIEEAEKLVNQSRIKDYYVVRFTTNDCEVIYNSKNPCIIISKCSPARSDLGKIIGSPMPYNIYKDKNFENPQGTSLIEAGPQIYTIKEVISNTRIKNGHVRATVIDLPNSGSRGFCIFKLRDPQGTEIQGVGFEQAATLFLKYLRLNEEYIFTGFVINRNRIKNEDELKFRNQAQILRITKTPLGQVLRNPSTQPKLEPQFQQPIPNQIQPEQEKETGITKQNLIQLIKENNVNNKFFTIVGKITYLNPKNMFRKINLQDKNGDIIDLVLWEEIKDFIQMEKIYMFTNLRVKLKNDTKDIKYVELQSSKNTTVSAIETEAFQLMSQIKQTEKNSKNYKPYIKPQLQSYREQRTKKLPQGSKIITLTQMIGMGKEAGEKNGIPMYPLVECVLKFRTQGIKFKEEADILNFFSFFCKPCQKAVTVTLNEYEQIYCNRCRKEDVQIKWNLRIKVIDLQGELSCCFQNQTTERYLNVNAREGFLLFMQSKQQFEKILQRVNFDERVCKFQVKSVGLKNYYNILEIYAKDTQTLIDKHLAELRSLMEGSNDPDKMEVELNEEGMAE